MKRAPLNLFDLRPQRAVGFELDADGRAVLVIPRFTNRVLVKLLVPLLKRPDIRVRLDEIGSFVWQQCDGGRTVAEIAAGAAAQFADRADGMPERVAGFVAQLDRQRLLRLPASSDQAAAR